MLEGKKGCGKPLRRPDRFREVVFNHCLPLPYPHKSKIYNSILSSPSFVPVKPSHLQWLPPDSSTASHGDTPSGRLCSSPAIPSCFFLCFPLLNFKEWLDLDLLLWLGKPRMVSGTGWSCAPGTPALLPCLGEAAKSPGLKLLPLPLLPLVSPEILATGSLSSQYLCRQRSHITIYQTRTAKAVKHTSLLCPT